MSWPQFRYIFTRDVENAMRYSIQEAMRRQCYGAEANAVANDAVESFKRKMDTHAPPRSHVQGGDANPPTPFLRADGRDAPR